jgi:nucleoid DNA-binding protein
MNKGDIIDLLAGGTGISKVQANEVVDILMQGATSALKKGERVALVGFGTFTVAGRKARTGRNPQTGAPLKIAACKVVKFAAGHELKAAINRGTKRAASA